MLDLTNAPEGFLDPVARVVEAALAATEELSAREVMVVGAACRDILHSADWGIGPPGQRVSAKDPRPVTGLRCSG